MKSIPALVAIAFGVTSLVAGAQSSSSAASGASQSTQSSGTVISKEPVRTESMQKLTQAAQQLRESIQLMAQKKHPGADRDAAISQAQAALLDTQRAMLELPPEMRSWGSVSTASYDESVKKLMKAADSLRDSIQEMAQKPAGDARNQAIRQANEALLETQSAMALAYTPQTRSGPAVMGAGSQAQNQDETTVPKALAGPAAREEKK